MIDHYAALGVARDATEAEIRTAFRRVAVDSHPDTHPGDIEAERRYRSASEAFATLSSAETRAAYDAELAASAAEGVDPALLERIEFIRDLGVSALRSSEAASKAGIPVKEQIKNVGVNIWNALKTPEGKAKAADLFGSAVRAISNRPNT